MFIPPNGRAGQLGGSSLLQVGHDPRRLGAQLARLIPELVRVVTLGEELQQILVKMSPFIYLTFNPILIFNYAP